MLKSDEGHMNIGLEETDIKIWKINVLYSVLQTDQVIKIIKLNNEMYLIKKVKNYYLPEID